RVRGAGRDGHGPLPLRGDASPVQPLRRGNARPARDGRRPAARDSTDPLSSERGSLRSPEPRGSASGAPRDSSRRAASPRVLQSRFSTTRMRLSIRGAAPPPGVPEPAGGFKRSWLWGAAASLLATAALFLPLRAGIPRAADLPYHLGTTAQVLDALRHGDLYPRWMPNFYDGMGEPTLVFYPPGLYLIAAGLSGLVGGDVLFGLFASLVLFAFAGSLGMFVFLRRSFGNLAAGCGSLLFALLPYRVFELYSAGLDSAFAAGCLLPWVFGALARESGAAAAGVCPFRLALALLFAAVVLLNLPTALFLAYLTAIWLAVEVVRSRRWRFAGRVLFEVGLGMLLAGLYLVPAILELPEIRIPMNARAVYTSNFLFQRERSWMTGGVQSMFDRMAIFPVIALVFGSLIVWAFARRDARAWPPESRRLMLTVAAVSFFLMTPVSLPFWKIFPVLRQVNLPWRLLEPLGVMSVAVVALASSLLLRQRAVAIPIRVAGIAAILAVVLLWAVFASSISEVNGKVSAGSVRSLIEQYTRMPGYFM